MSEFFAVLAAILFLAGGVLEVALASGAALGRHVFGGRFADPQGRLPPRWRVASAAASLVLVGFAWIILARADVVASSASQTFLSVLAWVVVGVMALNTAGNIAGKSAVERYVFGSATAVLVVACSVVAAVDPS